MKQETLSRFNQISIFMKDKAVPLDPNTDPNTKYSTQIFLFIRDPTGKEPQTRQGGGRDKVITGTEVGQAG